MKVVGRCAASASGEVLNVMVLAPGSKLGALGSKGGGREDSPFGDDGDDEGDDQGNDCP